MAEELGIHDIAVNTLKDRLRDAQSLIRERYKGVRPFRQPEIPDRELLYNYLKLTDNDKEFYRQTMGESWDIYSRQMEELRGKYNA